MADRGSTPTGQPACSRGIRPVSPAVWDTISRVPDQATERAAVIALLTHVSSRWNDLACELLTHESALPLLDEAFSDRDTLFPAPERVSEQLARSAAMLAEWGDAGIQTSTVLDEDYPTQLRDTRELPPVVFTRGLHREDTRAIAVVGTRRADERSLDHARYIADALARRDVTVVSGLAAGIDTAAHEATLATGGRTVAVIPTGIRRNYPPSNRQLQERIAAEGLVLSQFWPDAPPRRAQFLMRNAVMSGYAAATMVVEAEENSGARNQARRALEHGRPVVLFASVTRHEWARRLAERPGVAVATDPDEALQIADELLRQRQAELSSDVEFPGFAVV